MKFQAQEVILIIVWKERFRIKCRIKHLVQGTVFYFNYLDEINPTLNKSGSNFSSKFKDHKAMVFTNSQDRFRKAISGYPGPGNYNTRNVELNKEGRYSLSKMQNSKVRSFGSSARKSLNERSQSNSQFILAPGPGNYRIPSDFGYYANKSVLSRDISTGNKDSAKVESKNSHRTVEIEDLWAKTKMTSFWFCLY